MISSTIDPIIITQGTLKRALAFHPSRSGHFISDPNGTIYKCACNREQTEETVIETSRNTFGQTYHVRPIARENGSSIIISH
jgi:hypothetical protein